jgi:hypothetical protein
VLTFPTTTRRRLMLKRKMRLRRLMINNSQVLRT